MMYNSTGTITIMANTENTIKEVYDNIFVKKNRFIFTDDKEMPEIINKGDGEYYTYSIALNVEILFSLYQSIAVNDEFKLSDIGVDSYYSISMSSFNEDMEIEERYTYNSRYNVYGYVKALISKQTCEKCGNVMILPSWEKLKCDACGNTKSFHTTTESEFKKYNRALMKNAY